jgi:hypothetical protein
MGARAKQKKVGVLAVVTVDPLTTHYPKVGQPKVQPKAVPIHALPDQPGRNIHPAGQRKTGCSKEQIEAEREAKLKEHEEQLHIIHMAKEEIAQLNLMEEVKDDLCYITVGMFA